MSLNELLEKSIQHVSLVVRKCVGVLMLLFSGIICLAAIGAIVDDEDDPVGVYICCLITAALFGLPGYRLCAKVPDATKKQDDSELYYSLIVNQGHRDIETIAAIVGLDPKQVQQEVQSLMNQNQLVGWQMDPRTGKINKLVMNEGGGHTSYMVNKTKFKCAGCGAQNNIEISVGKAPECSFCGQTFTGELSS